MSWKLLSAMPWRRMVTRFLVLFVLVAFVVNCQFAPLLAEDTHLKESGSAALLARSAFAHGYRHGYELGFHQGNIDANMARPPKSRPAQFKGMPSGYESAFGARKSFEHGFTLGINAGYGDGYAGHAFRAVAELRRASEALDLQAPVQDPQNLNFDTGVASGYRDGFDRAASGRSEPGIDLRSVSCAQSPVTDKAIEEFYCDGYRRGYLLGYGDGAVSLAQRKVLEASQ
jgi:hypothetical protein